MNKKKLWLNLLLPGLILLIAACGDSTPASNGVTSSPTTPSGSAATATSAKTAPAATATVATNPTTVSATTAKNASTTAPIASATAAKVSTTAASSGAASKPTNEPIVLRFSEFYAPNTSPINLQFSDKLRSAGNQRVRITGYMAPPLKPDLDFFVLTRIRLVVCPFCSTVADWPEDIVLVTMPDGKTTQQVEEPITLVGKLEIGEAVDPQTGFLSLLRIRAESVEVFKGS